MHKLDFTKSLCFCTGLLAVSVFVGCHVPQDKPDVTWSAEVRSPDGQWIASAHSLWGGNYGGQYDITTVSLSRNGSKPEEVMVFDHQYTTLPLKLSWAGPTRLEVTIDNALHPNDRIKLLRSKSKLQQVDILLTNPPTSTF